MKKKLLINVVLLACNIGGMNCMASADEPKYVSMPNKVSESPDVYFKSFLYRTSGDCSNPTGFLFHFLSNFDQSIVLPNSPDGLPRHAILSVYLMDDGTYQANYSKLIFGRTYNGIPEYDEIAKQRLTGRAYLNSAKEMVLEGIGKMTELEYNGSTAAFLEIENTALTEGYVGEHVALLYVRGTSGLKSFNEVCR